MRIHLYTIGMVEYRLLEGEACVIMKFRYLAFYTYIEFAKNPLGSFKE